MCVAGLTLRPCSTLNIALHHILPFFGSGLQLSWWDQQCLRPILLCSETSENKSINEIAVATGSGNDLLVIFGYICLHGNIELSLVTCDLKQIHIWYLQLYELSTHHSFPCTTWSVLKVLFDVWCCKLCHLHNRSALSRTRSS